MRVVITDEVRRMSRSNKTIACEVSGGLDSSAIFAVAEHLRRKNQLAAPGIAAYSLVFPNDSQANEIEYSRAVGQHLRCGMREIPPTYMPYSWYARMADLSREFPGYPNGTMSLGLRQAAHAEGSSAILTGAGGDEWLGLLGSRHYYFEELALKNWRNAYDCFVDDLGTLGLRRAVWSLFRFGFFPLLPKPIQELGRRLRRYGKEDNLWLSSHLQSIMADRREKFKSRELRRLARQGQLAQFHMLNDAYAGLAREMEERMCSSIGLELRSPFNSRAIIEFAFSTPERFRSGGTSTKRMHRLAMKDILPESVVNRRTKADFTGTFRTELDKLGGKTLRQILTRRGGWVKPQSMIDAYDSVQAGRGPGHSCWILWTLVGCDAVIGERDQTYANN